MVNAAWLPKHRIIVWPQLMHRTILMTVCIIYACWELQMRANESRFAHKRPEIPLAEHRRCLANLSQRETQVKTPQSPLVSETSQLPCCHTGKFGGRGQSPRPSAGIPSADFWQSPKIKSRLLKCVSWTVHFAHTRGLPGSRSDWITVCALAAAFRLQLVSLFPSIQHAAFPHPCERETMARLIKQRRRTRGGRNLEASDGVQLSVSIKEHIRQCTLGNKQKEWYTWIIW